MRAVLDGVRLLWYKRELVWAMARRELVDRYAGQMLGAVWALAHPLLLMAVYLFIFGFVFNVRLGGSTEMPRSYIVYLLAGVVPWLALAEALNKAPLVITANANLVKQVVFPLEVLPAKSVLSSTLTQSTGLAVLAAYVFWSEGRPPLTYIMLPMLLGLHVVMMLGLTFILAAVGVFVRDLKDVVQVLTMIGIYLVPVFYLPAMVPDAFRGLLYLNPFSYLIWCYQDLCYYGWFAHPEAWLVVSTLSPLTFVAGWRVFHRLKPYFGNVL